MEELNSGQYQLVNIDNDDLKRIYPMQNAIEYVVNDGTVQYGQQQVIQVQSPDHVNGPVAHQQIQQVQLYQTQDSQPQFVQISQEDGSIVYHQVSGMQQQVQQEETVAEPQLFLELQTPREQQAAAYKPQIHLQQQQTPQPIIINQAPSQMPNQQVILQSPQQIVNLVHQPANTPQGHYYVATAPAAPQQQQYYIPQQTQQQNQQQQQSQQQQQQPQEQQQVQTRIVYQQAPTQNFQIQQPQQRIFVQQRQPTQISGQILQASPQQQQVRPQIVQQTQQVTPSGLRIVPRQIQRLPTQTQQIQQQPQLLQRVQAPRVPRQPRAQTPRQPRVNRNPGLQQATPQGIQQQRPIVYRMTTPQQRANSPQLQQRPGAVLQRVGTNVQIKGLQPGQRLVFQGQSPQGQIKLLQIPQQQTQVQVQQQQIPQQQQQQQQTNQIQTLKPGDDMDDIESSITAVIVKKQGPEEDDARTTGIKRTSQEMLSHGGKKSITGPKTTIRPASSISSRSSDDSADRESAKMLVILKSGEQRLITFTLPRETCTVQELLEQVNVPFDTDSNIRCISNPGSDIDYVVTVGISTEDSNEMIASAENSLKTPRAQPIGTNNASTPQQGINKTPLQQSQQQKLGQKTPDQAKNNGPDPKYIKGYYAICNNCGACSLDHSKCTRCKRIFKDDIKVIPIPTSNTPGQQKSVLNTPDNVVKRPMGASSLTKVAIKTHITPVTRGGARGGANSVRGRGRAARPKVEEPVILTLSSDDEDNSNPSSNSNGNNLQRNGSISGQSEKPPTTPLKCEPPSISDNAIPPDFCRHDVSGGQRPVEFTCRNIRIGTHKYDPSEKVVFSSRGCRLVAPSVKRPQELVILNIQLSEVVKLLYCFDKRLSVIFIYTLPSCGSYVRESLEMTLNEDGPYFNPVSMVNSKKKIVLLMDKTSPEEKEKLKAIFQENKIEEITYTDANELLIRSHKDPNSTPNVTSTTNVTSNKSENLLLYPKEGKGRIPINTNDYACLAVDQYLNDVIIDFYIKYLMHERLTADQRARTHVFSCFFYKRLTTMDKARRAASDKDLKLTAAQKRYQRVSKWNKDVDLFKKDFIIIPINEQSHWFLAIICFPRLQGPVTADGERPVKTPLVKRVKKKNAEAAAAAQQNSQNQQQQQNQQPQTKKVMLTIGNTTITAMKKGIKNESIEVPGDESERDEAEGDESELNSEDSGEEDTADPELQPIKQPCILIFDSLCGTSRSRVVATLRDYLTCEYRAKNANANPPIVFTKDNLPGHCLKVPQQNNFTDCGLYLLQYVEEFYANPIKDWRLPIKGLQNWFDALTVTKKREDISKLLEELIQKHEPQNLPLPILEFPTKDGVLIEMDETAEFEEAETDPGEGETGDEDGGQPKRRKTNEMTT
ncbi:uncharacterized protein LOC134831309 [Culicoides brevitarsis]|uniref:uncharacterized protein LOC134831309 n=1 Tax=Culicoides brevitarsis TaxID=469753 RepID=UPI00307BF1EE